MRASLLLALVSLVVAGCGAVDRGAGAGERDRALERYGISVTPPSGWSARLTRGMVEVANVPPGAPGQRPALGAGDVYVQLFEYAPVPQATAADLARTYTDGRPKPFTAAEFGPPTWELASYQAGNHSFARRNFLLSGRYFDLFVESETATPPTGILMALNALVASLGVRAGEFYPGSIEPPRFAALDGWWVGSGGAGEVRANDVAQAWAATVPYRNEPWDLPPARTLETLQPDGILIWVGLARDSRFPPTAELRHGRRVELPLTLAQTACNPGWEGQIRDDMSLCRLYGNVSGQYDVDLWVFFGVDEPSAEQRARAQVMLERLQLPDWGPWELDGRVEVSAS